MTKLPLDNERYRIAGTNAFNFSQWSRENEPKPPHELKVGDKVVFTVETEITELVQDCDGTSLYVADMIGGGWNEDHFQLLEAPNDKG